MLGKNNKSNCLTCKKEFHQKWSKQDKYCSPKCFYSDIKGKPRKDKNKCLSCGSDVNSRGLKIKYCSKKCFTDSRVGVQFSYTHRKKISDFRKKNQFGKKNPCWKGGITQEVMKIRSSEQMDEWRYAIYIRDNYECQNINCDHTSRKVNAHHILSFSKYPEHRFDINNGITLCIKCHKEIHRKPENRTFKVKFRIGKVEILSVEKIAIKQKKGSYRIITSDGISLMKHDRHIFRKQEGFSSSKDMFKFFDEWLDLSEPREMWTYTFRWVD